MKRLIKQESKHGSIKRTVTNNNPCTLFIGFNTIETGNAGLLQHPQFLVHSSGGPRLTDSQRIPLQGSCVNANGELTVYSGSNNSAEPRAKIVYENLMHFTGDPLVKETIGFLMTRVIAYMKIFEAALATIQHNSLPAVRQDNPRFSNVYYNLSNGSKSFRGPWNNGTSPVRKEEWE